MNQSEKSLTQLFIPIALETLFYMLAGMVDTLMLSSVGDNAVGAVGTANTYISVFIIMFNIIASGMIAVMTQYIGAGKPGVAYQARQIGGIFNTILGIILAAFLYTYSERILVVVGVAGALLPYARTYLKIVGGFCFLNALIPIFSSYLRAFGYTRQPMVATVISNILNFILNAVFLFGFKWGVAGVAYATVISKLLNLVIVYVMSAILIKAKQSPDRIKTSLVLKQIIKVGLPSALETLLYNVGMTLTIRFLNQMDPDGMNVTARSYACQITNFSYCIGAALAAANSIKTGWRIGAHEYDACDKGTKKAALIGVAFAAGLELLFALSGNVLIGFFTDNVEMISLVRKLLFLDIALEMGRVVNLVFGQALKTSGDAVYTSVIAAIFMYLFMVGGTWFLGIHLGLMVVGAYIGMAMDEVTRAFLMVARWQTGKWRTKGFIKS